MIIMIQYAGIVRDTIVDGIGLRNTLYVSGCPHHCPGCHNPLTQDYNYGKKDSLNDIYNLLTDNGTDNNYITFSGGEPFEQALELSNLAKKLNEFTNAHIWVYSGYTFEEIIKDPIKLELLKQCDVVVDGKFELNKRSLDLKFRGSSNQRIIDIQKSLQTGVVVELDD